MRKQQKTFLEHLEDLRLTLIFSTLLVIGGFFGSFFFRKEIINFLTNPAKSIYPKYENLSFLQAISPIEGFSLSIKTSFYTGLLITSPLLILLIFKFTESGLNKTERKSLFLPLFSTIPLFLFGAGFAYIFILPQILEFFYSYNLEMGISNQWRLSSYLSFVLKMLFIFGAGFQLPLIIFILVKMQLLDYQTMQSTRRKAWIILFIISAVLTPTPDMFTLLLLALPLIFLYEICIQITRIQKRRSLT